MDPKRRCRSHLRSVALGAGMALALLAINHAQADIALPPIASLPPVSVGAGLQTSVYSCDKGCIYSSGTPNPGSDSVQGAELDSIRLYLSGSVTDTIKLTFDTEYDGSTNQVGVLDAIGRFEYSDKLNIWAGRFLEPSDRANLAGPYYANNWAPFADGVADFYPFVKTGRDNGAAYWGQFGMLKVQAGFFDGGSLNSAVSNRSRLLYAGRAMLDFWDPEPGYYLNSTYYGEKDVLSVGLAAQSQDDRAAWDLEALMEKKLPDMSVLTLDAEFQKDNGLTAAAHSKGWYGQVSYLFPQVVGIGKIQLLGRYSQKTVDSMLEIDAPPAQSDKVKTAEFDANYIIKAFNARVGFYFLNQKDQVADTSKKEFGLKLQLQI
jgi:hypothetical protein